MQPKFVSRFPRVFEIEQELYRYLHLTSPMMITSLVLLGVIFVVNIVMCLISGLLYANMAVFAMVVIVLFVLFYRYYSAIQAGKKRLAEDTNNKGEVTVTATLTDEELISESSDREEPVTVPFSHFLKVFITKHYYMIQTTDKMVYVFKKDAFSVGKEEEFLPYVQQIIENNKRKRG
ncbi:MAG: YcxB family protein [Ruminococcus sp.]|nr:YcxB family protein [Ruminococcus sp.]